MVFLLVVADQIERPVRGNRTAQNQVVGAKSQGAEMHHELDRFSALAGREVDLRAARCGMAPSPEHGVPATAGFHRRKVDHCGAGGRRERAEVRPSLRDPRLAVPQQDGEALIARDRPLPKADTCAGVHDAALRFHKLKGPERWVLGGKLLGEKKDGSGTQNETFNHILSINRAACKWATSDA